MTDQKLFREAWQAGRGHLRLAERIAAPLAAQLRDAERSGRQPTMVEVATAASVSKELAEAQGRMERLKQLYRR